MDVFIIEAASAENEPKELLEKFCHKKISNQKRWEEHCLSYLMADRILNDFYQVKNRKIVFENNKPYLENRAKYFSISHSHDYIVLAFSGSECGIDIEKIKPRKFESIAEKMGFRSKTLSEFYKEWTKYEAEYKLACKAKILKSWEFCEYIITAVGVDSSEEFRVYIQKGKEFSNLNI